jgi:hypothetical protein
MPQQLPHAHTKASVSASAKRAVGYQIHQSTVENDEDFHGDVDGHVDSSQKKTTFLRIVEFGYEGLQASGNDDNQAKEQTAERRDAATSIISLA